MPMPPALVRAEQTATAADLGPLIAATNITSTLGPFHYLAGSVHYPDVVVRALIQLYEQYNAEFKALVQASMEWRTDYRYCDPANTVVQIDMVGLGQPILDYLADQPLEKVVEILRHRLFEIENSVAMYQLLQRICYPEGETSFLSPRWLSVLAGLRARHEGLPVALLAVTYEKYVAMLETEFGITDGQHPTPEVVRELTGFDDFYGPDQFQALVAASPVNADGFAEIGTLLYVRASDPVEHLKKPSVRVEHPLLGDEFLRRTIRAFTVTVNIDNPTGKRKYWINDTKSYAPGIGIGYAISSQDDLFDPAVVEFLAAHRIDLATVLSPAHTGILAPGFVQYLAKLGVSPRDVLAGKVHLRMKPLIASFGSYGHVRGAITDKAVRADLRVGTRQRGPYLVQVEMAVPVVTNTATGVEAAFIDRCWVGLNADDEPIFLGAFRNFMPTRTVEYKSGRIHGNGDAFWIAIVCS